MSEKKKARPIIQEWYIRCPKCNMFQRVFREYTELPIDYECVFCGVEVTVKEDK